MKEHFVIDPLISKRQQLLLATQLCRMVLKVCIESLFCIVVCYAHPGPTHPFHVLTFVQPPFRFIPCLDQSRALNVGEAGKLYTGSTCELCGYVTRGKRPLCLCLCYAALLAGLFTNKPCVVYPHSLRIFLSPRPFHITNTIERSTM
jgi:hypothetical protein